MADQDSIFCPNCHRLTNIIVRSRYQWPKQSLRLIEIGECNGCDYFVLVDRFNGQIKEIHPHPLPKKIPEKTPEFLSEDLLEAHKCFSVNAYRATAVLARRALQACCIEKGAPDKKLQEQIDWLLNQQIITKDLRDWAHEVKATGNDAAHPPKDISKDDPITKEDANDILTLLDSLIDVLYIAPALASEMRAKRSKS